MIQENQEHEAQVDISEKSVTYLCVVFIARLLNHFDVYRGAERRIVVVGQRGLTELNSISNLFDVFVS